MNIFARNFGGILYYALNIFTVSKNNESAVIIKQTFFVLMYKT